MVGRDYHQIKDFRTPYSWFLPMELCDGDPGSLSVTLRCEFPDNMMLDSLSLTLSATNNADEIVKAVRSGDVTILNPGRNTITLSLPPQKPGSYVLGVLTGQIGHLRFRSHGFSRGGPADSADLMSYDKPTRPILKVILFSYTIHNLHFFTQNSNTLSFYFFYR